MTTNERLLRNGLAAPDLLLPANTAIERWAAVACDQFTQDKGYWKKAGDIAGDAPSTLRMILPEAFLHDDAAVAATGAIHETMRRYLDGGVFAQPVRGFVYVERDTPHCTGRRGIVAAVDLERYSWSDPSAALIRPTEGTVAERLPPRAAIRRGAPLETSHVMMLVDDPADALIPGIGETARRNAPLYSGRLMQESGSVTGWLVSDAEGLADGLERLAGDAARRCAAGGGGGTGDPFLFAVGDGNHSLAAAKEIWEEYRRANPGDADHPCRYALAEIVNIHDPALSFEPIHRVIFGTDFDRVVAVLSELPGFSCRPVSGRRELAALVAEPVAGNRYGLACAGRCAVVETSAGGISTAALQPLLDARFEAESLDYIHGEDALFDLALNAKRPAVGILLPPVRKDGFFATVTAGGPLPRKSFSMGEACEKRFYVECRRLFG